VEAAWEPKIYGAQFSRENPVREYPGTCSKRAKNALEMFAVLPGQNSWRSVCLSDADNDRLGTTAEAKKNL